MKKMKQIEVSESWDEFFEAMKKIAETSKQALSDGWQPGQDIPAIVMSAISVLPGALSKMNNMETEYDEDTSASLKAAMIHSMDMVALFKK